MELGADMFEYCTNLVTVSIPSSIEYIPEDAFAGCPLFEDNSFGAELLPESLEDRFESLPIHRVCYFPSLGTPMNYIDLDSLSDSCDYSMDAFGMTPLHILATSGHLSPDLMVAVLDKYPSEILWRKDQHDKTAIDYLLWNKSPRAIPLIRITLERMIGASVGPHGLEEWNRALSLQAESVATCRFMERSIEYKEFYKLQYRFWKLEVTSVVELALWKKRMGPDPIISVEDRDTCHSLCGTDSVIPNVAGFL